MRIVPIAFLTVLSLFYQTLSANIPNQNDDVDASVAAMEGLPSNIVNGSVCAITGELIDYVLDAKLPGPETLVLTRSYSSSDKSGNYGSGWNSNHADAIYYSIGVIDEKPYEICKLNQPSGASLCYTYRHHKDNEYKKTFHMNLKAPKGLSNGCGGRKNLKNQKITRYQFIDQFICQTAEGNERLFKHLYTHEFTKVYKQYHEDKINGSSYDYKLVPVYPIGINKIECSNRESKKVYSTIEYDFDRLKDFGSITLTTSDDRSIKYRYFKENRNERNVYGEKIAEFKDFYLKDVICSHKPHEFYDYDERHGNAKGLHLSKKFYPDNRYLAVEYYHAGDNSLGKKLGHLNIKYNDDYRINRVKCLKAPAGTTAEPVTINRFIYHLEKETKDNRTEYLDGHTYVYDALGHQTRYNFNKEHRLTSITKFLGTDNFQKYSAEKYVWGKNGSADEGNLIGKYLTDANDNILYYQLNKYDAKGNIIESRLYGNLTGKKNCKIELDEHRKPLKDLYEREIKKFTYNDLNLVKEEIDSNGVKTTYRYKPGTDLVVARIVSFNDETKSREFLEYDENNVMCKKIVDDGYGYGKKDLRGITERHITVYHVRTKQPIGLVEHQDEYYLDLDTNQEVYKGGKRYEYTKQGYVTKEERIDADGISRFAQYWDYDNHGNVIEEINPLNEKITKRYDANDNLIRQHGPHPGFSIENQYDYMNRLYEKKERHSNGNEYVTTHSYNYLGQCISTVNPYNQETLYEYDELGRLIKTKLPRVKDENEAVVKPEISNTFNIAGYPATIVDAMGHETKIEYNARGKPLRIIFSDQTEEFYEYELNGQLRKKIEKNGSFTVYERDYQGRVLKELTINSEREIRKTKEWTYNAYHVLTYTDPENILTTYNYDYAGRLIRMQKENQVQEYTYDSLGRQNVIKEWLGEDYRLICKEYDDLNRVTEEKVMSSDGQIMAYNAYRYDCNGNKIFIQEGYNITCTEYDSLNNPIKIINALGHETHAEYNTSFRNDFNQKVLQTTITDALGNITVETYDSANRLVETVRKNSMGITTASQKIFYDLCGNKRKVVDDIYVDEEIKRQTQTLFTYTVDNQIESITEAAGTEEQKTVAYRYNQFGQKSQLIKPDGVVIHYEYDELGRLKTVVSSDNTIAYTYHYNKNDQLISLIDEIHHMDVTRSYNQVGELENETLGHRLSINYLYDNVGQLKLITLPDQTQINYEYNAANLTAVHRLKGGNRVYSQFDLKHDLTGNTIKSFLPDQSTVKFTFDALGRSTSIDHPLLSQLVPKDGYDPAGNLLKYSSRGTDYEFQYDDLYQVKSEKGHVQHSYQYDSLCNRLKKDDETYDINVLNQLKQRGEEKYEYDPNGNLCKKEAGEETTHYQYDALDRLVKVTKNGQVTHYLYDGLNRRLKKIQNDKETCFLFAAQEEIGAVENNQITQLKVISKGNRAPAIALELKGEAYVPLYDIFGHLASLHDLEGKLIESYLYTAFGEVEILDAAGSKQTKSIVDNPWMYANRRFDPETGFIAFGLRYYDPESGRWISADPAGFADGPNLYAYVHNNPLAFFDEYGLFANINFNPVFDIPILSTPFTMINYMTRDILQTPVIHRNFEGNQPIVPPSIDNCEVVTKEFGRDGHYNMNEHYVDQNGDNYTFKENSKILMTYTNGIGNSFEDFSHSLCYLSTINDYNVHGIFWESRGFAKDAEIYYNAHYKFCCYDPARMLHAEWYQHLKENSDGIVIHFAHSCGATHTRNALMDFPEDLKSRIHVIAIAPGSTICPSICGSIVHLCSKRDFVPLLDVANLIRNRNTVVMLNPHPNAPFLDHPLMSPTYGYLIQLQTTKIRRNHEKIK